MGPRVSGAKAPSRGTTPVGLPGTYRKPDLNSMDTAGAGSGVGSAGKTDSQRLQQAELTAHDGG
jgi:hypothetical protein